MADIVRVTEKVRVINPSTFASHSGTVYVQKLHGEDSTFGPWVIWAALGTIANFNAAPVGSILWDTADYLTQHVHDTATTWKSSTFA